LLSNRLNSNQKIDSGFDALSRKCWKKRWRHLYREFLEHAHRTRDVPVAQVNHRKIKYAEVPLRHDLNKPPVAQQLGPRALYEARRLLLARLARQCQCRCNASAYLILLERQ
jgi:cation diffusion facilitator CzcD-associated flavoprotein CzcO